MKPPADRFEAARRAFAAGDFAGAETSCLASIAATARDGRPYAMLAELALRRSQPAEALQHAERAIRLSPDDFTGQAMRAKSLASLGRPQAAIEAAEAGLRIEPCPAQALDAFGAIFSMLGRHRRALELFKRAAAAEPDNPQILFNLAAAERMTGALEESERHCDQVLALDPHHYQTHYLRADLRVQTPARNHLSEMESLIATGVCRPEGAVLLHYALGKEYEDLGEDARAFDHYRAGAGIHRRQIRYDPAADLAALGRIAAAETAAALRQSPPGYAAEAPVFIVGLPRSGTTLVERILGAHSRLVSAGELGAFPVLLRQFARPGAVFDPAALGRAYVAAARATGISPILPFIDKLPQNYLYCGAIRRALPQARIVVVKRHPMDSCFALYKAHFAGTWPFSYDLEELGRYYAGYRKLIRHWCQALPPGALLEVAYEDIVGDLEREARRLLAFLGLAWEPAVLEFHASTAPSATASAVQVRRPLYATSVGRWRRHAVALAPLRRLLQELVPEEMAD